MPRLFLLCSFLIALSASAQQRRDYMADYDRHPGGTPEEELWQVLVLRHAEGEWNSKVSVSAGEVFSVEGYRFEPPDRIEPEGGWSLTVRVEQMETGEIVNAAGGSAVRPTLMPKGVLVQGRGSTATVLRVDGAGDVRPMTLRVGQRRELSSGVSVQRIPATTDLSGSELRQHDFPSISAATDGSLSAVWMSYHDRREELNFRQRLADGRWTRLLPVGRAREDLWRPQVAHDAQGKPWLIWSERPTSDGPGNWDLYAMAWEDNAWGERVRLSRNPLPDIEPAIARASNGTIYVVWQALRGRSSQIRLRYLKSGQWSETISVTNTEENNWNPAIATGPDDEVWIAWDRYAGDYNVHVRRFSIEDGLSDEHEVLRRRGSKRTPRWRWTGRAGHGSHGRPIRRIGAKTTVSIWERRRRVLRWQACARQRLWCSTAENGRLRQRSSSTIRWNLALRRIVERRCTSIRTATSG